MTPEQMQAIVNRIAILESGHKDAASKLQLVKDKVDEVDKSMKELVALFTSAKGVLSFVKVIGSIAMSFITLWYMATNIGSNWFNGHKG